MIWFSILLGVLILIIIAKRLPAKRPTVTYIETSAINYLADISTLQDAIATRKFHANKNSWWAVSVVSIWEVLLNSSQERREDLIMYMQRAFHNKLLISPSEIVVNFIRNGCPVHEKQYSVITKQDLGRIWTDICEIHDKTLILDYTQLRANTEIVRKFFRRIDRICAEIIDEKASNYELKQGVDEIYLNLNFIEGKELSEDQQRIYKLSILFILAILVIGITLDNGVVEEFWEEKGISSSEGRVHFLFTNYEVLVHRGPFLEMAFMAYNQIVDDGKSVNRGIFWDALHSLYLPYVDFLLTKDMHFKNLKDRMLHPNYSKIVYLEDGTIVWREMDKGLN